MTARGPEELGNPGPHWRGDGTLAPRRELRVERGLEPRREFDPTLTLPPPERVRVAGLEVADFGRRFGSTAVDGLILILLVGIAAAIAQIGLDPAVDETRVGERVFGATLLVMFGYLLPTNALGWSPGKGALGLRVVQADGSRPGVGVGISRTLVALPPIALIGLFWAAIDSHSQAWHDKAAGTYVVRKQAARPPSSGGDEVEVSWEFPERPGG